MTNRLIAILMLIFIKNAYGVNTYEQIMKDMKPNTNIAKLYNIFLDHTLIANLETKVELDKNIHNMCFYNPNNSETTETTNKYKFCSFSEKESYSIILNLLYRNKLPLEHEILTIIKQIIQNHIETNIFQIEMVFYKNLVSDFIIYKSLDFMFIFHLINNKTNFLLFSSKDENPQLITDDTNNNNNGNTSIDEFFDIKHSKITLVNIAALKTSSKEKNEDKVGNSQFFVKSDDSPASISPPEIKRNYSLKKLFRRQKSTIDNGEKTFDSSLNGDEQYNVCNILNRYSNSEIEDIIFLLSPRYLNLLLSISTQHRQQIDNKYYQFHKNIFLINPYFPIFCANTSKVPQLLFTNIYILGITSEIIHINDKQQKFIFHFYDPFNYKTSTDNNDMLNNDFLTVYTDENDLIYKIIIRENDHEIIFHAT